MQNAAVLHASARAHANRIHIAANDRGRPHRDVVAKRYIADHDRGGIDEYALTELRFRSEIRRMLGDNCDMIRSAKNCSNDRAHGLKISAITNIAAACGRRRSVGSMRLLIAQCVNSARR